MMKTTSGNLSKSKSGGTTPQPREPMDRGMTPANDAIPREQFIAVAAYFRAEQRGFAPGNELSDWLDAEADVEKALGSSGPATSIS